MAGAANIRRAVALDLSGTLWVWDALLGAITGVMLTGVYLHDLPVAIVAGAALWSAVIARRRAHANAHRFDALVRTVMRRTDMATFKVKELGEPGGDHVRFALYAGEHTGSRAKCGELTMRREEFAQFRQALAVHNEAVYKASNDYTRVVDGSTYCPPCLEAEHSGEVVDRVFAGEETGRGFTRGPICDRCGVAQDDRYARMIRD